VLKSAAVYIPLDPDHPAERLAAVIADTGASIAVTLPEHRDLLPPGVTVIFAGEDAGEDASDRPGESPPVTILPSSLAYVIHTSGSTGRPKGVAISHRAYAHHCQVIARAYGIQPDDRVVLLAALIFDVAMDQIAATLVRGATVVAGAPQFWTARELPDQIAALRITIMETTPAYYREVMHYVRPADERLRHLRLMNVGSDVVTYDDARRWAQTRLPGRFLVNYGPTEATVTCTLHQVSAEAMARAHPDSVVPIGRPVSGTCAYVLDGSGGLVPVGVAGELHLAGIRLARGYLGQPGLTAEKFVPSPFGPSGARLYRTGDLVRWLDGGCIEFLGRIDTQVKVRGYRIELGDVEAALSHHPDVRAAAVTAWGDPQSRELAAYIVPRAEALTTIRDLRLYLKGRLPGYMIPVHWMVLSELPLTASRKVDRAALPAPDQVGARAEYVAPGDPVEQVIAEVWQEVLGADAIGARDDFFLLGGHSLLAARVHTWLCATFSIELPLRVLFQETVLADLASAVRQAVEADIDSLTDAEVAALLAEE
jgi:amino acid adenylation domain-containing protein